MDKHQRKALRKWETKKAKDQLKFEEYMKQHSREVAWAKVEQAIQDYEPPPDVVFSKALTLASKYKSYRYVTPLLAFDEDAILRYYMIVSSRVRLFMTELDILAEIAERKADKLSRKAESLAFNLLRHQRRVDMIRDEMLIKTTRLRAIQNCRNGFKEELMMKVWHPDRVEKFLETYGWEAFDNLLGVE